MISALRKRFTPDEQAKLLSIDENTQNSEENGRAVGKRVTRSEQNGRTAHETSASGYGSTD